MIECCGLTWSKAKMKQKLDARIFQDDIPGLYDSLTIISIRSHSCLQIERKPNWWLVSFIGSSG
jgi:hypothetical protein